MENRHLDFNAFVAQRANEIANFTEILQSDTRKKGHQSLPKSVRRRAMSHNRYRIPLKLRRPMEEELIKSQMMQRLPKCRKNIRKSHLLIQSYQKRNSGMKWLSTHLWAVKRMEMVDYHGYKIALKPKDKCFRSAYRHFRHNACLMDYSYLQCVRIIVTNKEEFHQIIFDTSYDEKEFCQAKLVDDATNLICHVLVFPETKSSFMFFCDPCTYQEIRQLKWNGCQVSYQHNVEFYLILGPSALERVEQVLTNMEMLPKQKVQQLRSLKMSSRNLMYLQQSCKQKILNKPLISSPHPIQIAQNYDKTSNKILRQQFFQNLLLMKKTPIDSLEQAQKFWAYYRQKNSQENKAYQNFKDIFKVTTRSKYTHKRKTKVTKLQKRKFLKNQEEVPEKIVQQLKQMQAQQKTPTIQIQEETSHGPLIVSWFCDQKSNKQMLQGCVVLCGSEKKCEIWRNLTRTNMKVIGKREYFHFLLQSGVRAFPNDYPGTKSFSFYNKARTEDQKNKYQKKPAQKKINFAKILSPSPFSFVVPEKSLISLRVLMVSGGRCFPGSYICRIQQQDLADAQKQLSENSCINKLSVQQMEENSKDQNRQFFLKNGQQLGNQNVALSIKTRRQVIGFVTSGGYLYNECREGGIGYIEGFQGQQNEYVLIRKPTSRFYYLAHTHYLKT